MGRQGRSHGPGLLERTGGKRLDRPAQQCLRTVARAYTPRPRAPEDLRLLMRRASSGRGSLQVAPAGHGIFPAPFPPPQAGEGNGEGYKEELAVRFDAAINIIRRVAEPSRPAFSPRSRTRRVPAGSSSIRGGASRPAFSSPSPCPYPPVPVTNRLAMLM